jgi:hypothetical protein
MRELSRWPHNSQSHCIRYELVKKNSDLAVTISGFTLNRRGSIRGAVQRSRARWFPPDPSTSMDALICISELLLPASERRSLESAAVGSVVAKRKLGLVIDRFIEVVYASTAPIKIRSRKNVLNLADRISGDRSSCRIVAPMIQRNSGVPVQTCRKCEARQRL